MPKLLSSLCTRRESEKSRPVTFDRRIMHLLRKAGWREGKDETELAAEYEAMMPGSWNTEAARFVRSFGNLLIARCLWVRPEPVAGDLFLRTRVEQTLGRKCCPVALSRYLDNESSLWIDSNGCFYGVTRNSIVFLADKTGDALDVLLLDNSPFPAPPEIRERLARGFQDGAAH